MRIAYGTALPICLLLVFLIVSVIGVEEVSYLSQLVLDVYRIDLCIVELAVYVLSVKCTAYRSAHPPTVQLLSQLLHCLSVPRYMPAPASLL